MRTLDANEAVAQVAYRLSEIFCIYPITPSSTMAEWVDDWAASGKTNLWGSVPAVVEMQSEGGAAGALHGALQGGSLAATFTASQGLLLMIPDMYKIAGELTPTVFHVTARTIATHALSIFGDQSDVMAVRGTGFALLASNNVQEAADMALVAHAATLETRVPFLHFFDGFRTSHEVSKAVLPTDAQISSVISEKHIVDHRQRALTPEKPHLKGSAQNPDVFFQAREAANPYYQAVPEKVQEIMVRLTAACGRDYRLYEYHGSPTATRVIVIMGSGADVAHETVDALNGGHEKVGVLKVRLFRPFSARHFVEALPPTVRSIAVLDRAKEPGALGEPLYQDVVTALEETDESLLLRRRPKVVGGRYGLSSKEFTPAMVKAVFDNLKKPHPKNHFTVGIHDDVSHTSLPYDPHFTAEGDDVFRALFYGLGSDGTVGANKNSIKIIGENTPNWAQGFFVYDSKKSGTLTVSHLRFGPRPIRSSYLITQARFIACHQPQFIGRYDMLSALEKGGTFLLNSDLPTEKVWESLPRKVQEQLQKKKAKFYVIDAAGVAEQTGMGGRINTIMQSCFFAISGVLPKDQALEAIRKSIRKSYQKKGEEVVAANLKAVDDALAHLHEMEVVGKPLNGPAWRAPVTEDAPEFVKDVLGPIIAGKGDELPVSAFPVDGTFPTGTARYEKRNLAREIPVWNPGLCIQCSRCALVCPHAAIRVNAYEASYAGQAPATFKSMDAKHRDWKGMKFTVQVAPEDCTGCTLCVDICPGKDKTDPSIKCLQMSPQPALVAQERANWEYFLTLTTPDPAKLNPKLVMHQQTLPGYFEFSGACLGCGETPYIKLATQLAGDRMIVANATGCSSIYGGNLPTTPWTKDKSGRGPAWANSLFEDNAEFGMGIRLSTDLLKNRAVHLLQRQEEIVGKPLIEALLTTDQSTPQGVEAQRWNVVRLKEALASRNGESHSELADLADHLVEKTVWIMGGDGWAYDIGFGGLDHVLASGHNVKVLVLDTEVYSNTGGQQSKATPLSAVARFAAGGKKAPKKDLGMHAMGYGTVYVASVAMGANDAQTLRAFQEALSYPGPALIIAYSHCIAHGIRMEEGLQRQKLAVQSGQWLLYRYDPRLKADGKNPLQLDCPEPNYPLKDFLMGENRFRVLLEGQPDKGEALAAEAQEGVLERYRHYLNLSQTAVNIPIQPAPTPVAG
ncbi:MAG TPA: pyruvate:ferredoxin (flavodoxin) oxidoreductase [bacterium]|nr:pyruvate:ferredoxin (flavodoxin) oxidoreductase [bacterium]